VKKSEWNDKELMELLKEMPKIEDYRHPRDIYQNLSHKRRKKIPWLLPGVAAAAALFLFFILVPKLMDGNQISVEHAKQDTAQEAKLAKENNNSSGMANGDTQQDQASIQEKAELSNEQIATTAVYDVAVKNGTVLTYWIPDEEALNLVPVSTIVNNPDGQDLLTLYNENSANLDESKWGLTDYYPLKATLSYDKNTGTLTVDVPADHPYGQGSTAELIFINTIKNIALEQNAQKIMFMTNGEPGLETGNDYYEEMDVSPVKNHAFFFYYSSGSEVPFLVHSPETYKDIDTALLAMKSTIDTHRLQGINLEITDVSSSNQTVTITFADNINNDQQTVWSLEAILLTAKDFGFEKVIINNPPIDQLGPFDLTKEITVPQAPNLRELK
jgi:hypothetical protein